MIAVQDKYKELYTDTEKFIILITGGRGSAKSYNASTFVERLTFEKGHKILYSRYTMSSASISVIPEFSEKIEADGTQKYFKINKSDIRNKRSKSSVMFRGIRTSSGNQTAKLKSIQGLTTFVCDEAEEWVKEADFDKLVLSIRQKGVQNRVIIIMNPSDVNHFIYNKYIKNTHRIEVIDGVEVEISTHPSVLHIHTTYLDNIQYLGDNFLKEVETMKIENPEKYAHVVIGKWASTAEGVIFKKFGIVKEFPAWCKKVAIGLDFGYTNDPTAAIKCGVIDNALYLDELFFETHLLSGDIINKLKPYKDLSVISDSADPRLIKEIKNGGVKIYPVEKGAGSIKAGIDKMLEMEIYVTERSYNLIEEFRHYTWDKDKNGKYINEPIDKFNHGMDAARYFVLGKILGKIKYEITDYTGIF